MKRIEIVVNPDGKTVIETEGFSGSSCQEATRFLEKALGERSGERLTGEFYQPQPIEQADDERA